MNALITNLHDRMADRNHTKLFSERDETQDQLLSKDLEKEGGSKKKKTAKKKSGVDGNAVYELNEPTGSFLDVIELDNPDNSAYIRQLLKKGRISPMRRNVQHQV